MKKVLNPNTTLLAVGVLQPTSAAEVRGFLNTLFPKSGALPLTEEIEEFLSQQNRMGRLVRLNSDGSPFYSLSLHGSYFLTADLRKTRDKFRAYLLRDAHRVRFIESREVIEGDLAGASPASDTSSRVKGRAANKLGRTAFGRRFAYGRPYWPRIPRQFANKTGQSRSSRDTFPSFLSFESKEQWALASNKEAIWDYVGLGLCLGLSPQLIWNISHQQDRHYRSFEIAKRGGGTRTIESPRVFLKVIQWFLADFVLDDLCCHDSVHSFRSGRSIVTNASMHVGAKFVGNVDIENFFGNITTESIARHLMAHGFNEVEATIISNLSSKGGRLPQGAPTSPLISNALLFPLDETATQYCNQNGLKYSRYADDITVSGPTREIVAAALNQIPIWLRELGLTLNQAKTRIASYAGQQRVTGVIVNAAAAPPRDYRRKVRAMFHQAKRDPIEALTKIPQLGGAIGFLKIFPKLQGSNEVNEYESVLLFLKEMGRGLPSPQ